MQVKASPEDHPSIHLPPFAASLAPPTAPPGSVHMSPDGFTEEAAESSVRPLQTLKGTKRLKKLPMTCCKYVILTAAESKRLVLCSLRRPRRENRVNKGYTETRSLRRCYRFSDRAVE